jgi:hypothetical protein
MNWRTPSKKNVKTVRTKCVGGRVNIQPNHWGEEDKGMRSS